MKMEIKKAAASFWKIRRQQQERQRDSGREDAGLRGAVTGGAQMDAFAHLVCNAIIESGIQNNCIYQKTALQLPGYYRPEKKWDLLVIYKGILGAAIELKSQVGPSFGNNFNNRTEEAIGSATDLWTAFRENRLGSIVRPFLGYVFLLEDCPRSNMPVDVVEPHFKVDPIFKGASYAQRYEIFCRRLVLERLYDASCFMTSTSDINNPEVHEPRSELSFKYFLDSLKGHMKSIQLLNFDNNSRL